MIKIVTVIDEVEVTATEVESDSHRDCNDPPLALPGP